MASMVDPARAATPEAAMATKLSRPLPRGEHGATIAEFCVVAVLATVVVSATIALSYLCFARAWTSYWAYESAICAASKESIANCESRLRHALANGLPIGRIARAHVERRTGSVQAEARVEIASRYNAESTRRLPLPLPARATRFGILP